MKMDRCFLCASAIFLSVLVPACGSKTPNPDPEPEVVVPQWKKDTLSAASITLPSFFSNDMLLQRNATVTFHGEAAEGDTVRILPAWTAEESEGVTTKDGKWTVKVSTPDAGGPYTVAVYNKGRTVLKNVLIGDVWFCSGQSNMEMPLPGFDGQPPIDSQADIAAASPDVPIRMFIDDNLRGKWRRQYAKEPQEDIIGSWELNTPDNVRYCSAISYYFAKILNEKSDVPIGVIVSSLGGSKIQSWMSEDAVKAYSEIDVEAMKNAELTDENHSKFPCVLYNAKVAPFFCLPIKGMVWYQGESNYTEYLKYPRYQKSFVDDLRAKWNCGDFPFLFVQIAPWNYSSSKGLDAARFRAAQSRSAKEISNAGMVCIMDLGDEQNIHPVRKKEVSERLVNYALALAYGDKTVHYKSPECSEVTFSGSTVRVKITGQSNLAGVGTTVSGFEMAGKNGQFYDATARISGSDEITLSSPDVTDATAVRYCYHNFIEATVFDVDGLPLDPFYQNKK